MFWYESLLDYTTKKYIIRLTHRFSGRPATNEAKRWWRVCCVMKEEQGKEIVVWKGTDTYALGTYWVLLITTCIGKLKDQ